MTLHRREWGVGPPIIAMHPLGLESSAFEAFGLTLAGQSESYWAGEHSTASELNPLGYPLLAFSPWLFIAVAVSWLGLFSAFIIGLPRRLAGWLAVGIALGHALGGSTWLSRDFGIVAAVAYLAIGAELSAWCWRQYGLRRIDGSRMLRDDLSC